MKKPSQKKSKPGQKLKAPTEAAVTLSLRRKWLFRFIALGVVPLVLLGGLEVGLRLFGYGYATGFFEQIRVGDKEYLVNNENFSLRFFPPQLARWSGPVMFESRKPAGSYRIFVLGESAARGEPEPNYAASRYLQALLAERYPPTHFEVINLGITAINSHVIRPIAQDCAKADGDLWIVYMGNNEMVGPFGAATVFGAKAPPLGLVRLNLAIQKTRLGQLIADASRKLHGKNVNESWGGMKMFLGNQLRADDARKEIVYQNFARNLDDIVQAGLGSGANILLNTVAVNLKDCPPFASLTNAKLSAGDTAAFEKLFSEARGAAAQNDLAGGAEKFAAAAILDPLHPELQFRWAQCLAQAGNEVAARAHFQKACDADALPFRADSVINGAIATAGKRFVGNKLVLFDAASALAAETADGVCGQETFYEHVHFNFDGEFRLGRAWAAQVEKILPPKILRGAATNGWAAQETCAARLGLTDWNRCAVTEMVIDRLHRPPLSGQLNNAQRLESLRAEARALRQRMNPATAQVAEKIYTEAIQRSPTDHLLHQNFAEFLESAGDLNRAEAEWGQVRRLLPHSADGFYQDGRLLAALERWPEAETALRRAVTVRPQLMEAWYEMGNTHLGSGQLELALADFAQARRLNPTDVMSVAMTGKALSKLNRPAAAAEYYQRALQMQPDLWEVRFALGDTLVAMNQIVGAAAAYAEVVRLKPDNALAHLDWGVMQARLGQLDAATEQFQETLRLEPGNQQAREYLLRVQGWKQRQH